MSLVPAELLLTAAAVFTVIKIAAEQQSQRKPVRVRGEEEPEQRADEEAAN
jgi:hypothetical protein